MSTGTIALGKKRAPVRPARILLHLFLAGAALAWLAPMLWALYSAMRPYAETSEQGYVSWPDTVNFGNFTNAFSQSDMGHYFVHTVIITVPAVLLTLCLSSMVAFYVSRSDFRLNLALPLVDLPGVTMSGRPYDSALGLVHAAARADRGRAGGRRLGMASVPADRAAAVPSGDGGPGDAAVHLDLQRLLLGPGADLHRREHADHLTLGADKG